MKKLFAILLTVAMLASTATIASAANTTTLTTTVPAASYTLNIPADQEIPFGTLVKDIGELSVTNSANFAEGKNLNVTVTYTAFEAENITTTIPFNVHVAPVSHIQEDMPEGYLVNSGKVLVFKGKADGTAQEHTRSLFGGNVASNVAVEVKSEDWGKALAGDYTATITFTAEVVVE